MNVLSLDKSCTHDYIFGIFCTQVITIIQLKAYSYLKLSDDIKIINHARKNAISKSPSFPCPAGGIGSSCYKKHKHIRKPTIVDAYKDTKLIRFCPGSAINRHVYVFDIKVDHWHDYLIPDNRKRIERVKTFKDREFDPERSSLTVLSVPQVSGIKTSIVKVIRATRLSNSIAIHRDNLFDEHCRKFYDMRSASKVFDEMCERLMECHWDTDMNKRPSFLEILKWLETRQRMGTYHH
ncbi:hypothetical protein Tco_0374192 [Tanacetum coccineum]